MDKINIRKEKQSDYYQVFEIHQKAFGQKDESRIVENIRKSKEFVPELSLVAEIENNIVGHILFSKISISGKSKNKETLSLAPMAVLPEWQRKGIGEQLIRAGFQKALELGFDSVIVLGHPEYYPKFGFRKASKWGITCPFEVPEAAFMAIELEKEALQNCDGKVVYPPAFNL